MNSANIELFSNKIQTASKTQNRLYDENKHDKENFNSIHCLHFYRLYTILKERFIAKRIQRFIGADNPVVTRLCDDQRAV